MSPRFLDCVAPVLDPGFLHAREHSDVGISVGPTLLEYNMQPGAWEKIAYLAPTEAFAGAKQTRDFPRTRLTCS